MTAKKHQILPTAINLTKWGENNFFGTYCWEEASTVCRASVWSAKPDDDPCLISFAVSLLLLIMFLNLDIHTFGCSILVGCSFLVTTHRWVFHLQQTFPFKLKTHPNTPMVTFHTILLFGWAPTWGRQLRDANIYGVLLLFVQKQ